MVFKTLKRAVVAAVVLITPVAASADHYMQTADPQVVQAFNEMIGALGQGCNAGNASACQAIPQVQQSAHMMLTAGYDCQVQGNQQACAFYQNNLGVLQNSYAQVLQAHQTGMLYQPTQAMPNAGMGMGMTHEQRMQEIHNMGVANTMRYEQRQQMMDNNHQQFLDMIRQ